ncbi:MAG: NAD(+)/NADH kinase [Candidatus Melainabacteria bacterium]|nr:NAD(+)/NADH kinase [Candidatus Melainabacteria bacterium]
MKLRRVLVVFKKSTFQIQALEHREPRFLKLVDEGHVAVTRVKVAHSEHQDTLELLQKALTVRNIEFKSCERVELRGVVNDVDLVISVGGDGTFLDASHYVHTVPLLGVNSSRSSSFGHFCIANEANIGTILDGIVSDEIKPCQLLRLELTLNGSTLPELVLNEVLVCHSNPAGTSRYFLEVRECREEQRSGGIWIGPPAGSTGALRAAGGQVLPITAQQYQYVVREPGPRPDESWQLVGGLLNRSDSLRVLSQMRTGTLFIDGQHIDYCFALGDELVVSTSKQDLVAYVKPETNNIFVEHK